MTRETAPQPEFSWFAHPARERIGAAAAAALVIAGLAAISGVLMQSPWWAGLAAIVVLVALNRFFLPSRFSIDGQGITARYPLRRQRFLWADLRRFDHDDRAGWLSGGSRRRWRRASRGLLVFFGGHRERVIAGIRAHLGARDAEGGAAWAR